MQKSVFDLNNKIKLSEKDIKEVMILGASGSVGTQAFDLCVANQDRLRVKSIISGKNLDETIRQGVAANPDYIVMSEKISAEAVEIALKEKKINSKVFYGKEAKKDVIKSGHDIAVTAIPGIHGLDLTLEAIKYSKLVAFANKETIIYAGDLMLELAEQHGTCIIPIDSEHNAIFQILDGLDKQKVAKIILTASGGPFLYKNYDEIKNASVEDVLKHPTWDMGRKITVDSATLFNKALEVIEASYLFGFSLDDIEAIIHPESIVHGMVRLVDESLLMHAALPDMKLPIAFALGWPNKTFFSKPFKLTEVSSLNFLAIDKETFPLFDFAINAAKNGNISRIAINYANEAAVQLFLEDKIKFSEIHKIVMKVMDRIQNNEFELDRAEYCNSVQKLCLYLNALILNLL